MRHFCRSEGTFVHTFGHRVEIEGNIRHHPVESCPTLLPKAYDKESNCDLLPIVIEPLLRLHEAKITAPANSAMKHNVLFILLI